MSSRDSEILADVRTILAAVSGDDETTIARSTRVLYILRDDSIGVLDFRWRLEKRFGKSGGVDALFRAFSLAGRSRDNALEEVALFQTRLGFIDWSSLPEKPTIDDLKSIVTVETIVRVLERELTRRDAVRSA